MNSQSCPVLLLDGGLGTTLEGPPYNVQFSSSTPLWSSHLLIDSPDTLLAAQSAFVRAGADVLLTATYQASGKGFVATLPKLEDGSSEGVESDSHEESDFKSPSEHQWNSWQSSTIYMKLAVNIAREAIGLVENEDENLHRGRAKLVALSLGAYGACMTPSQEYTGNYPNHVLGTELIGMWHNTRLSTFQYHRQTWDEIDLVAFETIPLQEEIHDIRIVFSAGEVSPALQGVPPKSWYISCVFPNNDMKLPDSTPIKGVVEAMLANDIPVEQWVKWPISTPWGIGINCTKVSRLASLIEAFEDAIKRLEGEGRLGLGKPYEKSSIRLKGSSHSKWPWLVLCPDGTRNEEYNTSTQTWEVKPDGNNETLRSWDEEIFEIVKSTRQRGLWPGILVGGCCRTSPSDIERLRKRIDELE
ncbi:hypothetical protein MMC11_001658 [Xylographa trunciseda]|nr:hypothetical protein [Xylographa trunciseda]